MTMLIETDRRVFELTITPGDEVPGHVVRTATVHQISGEPLTNEEWLAALNAAVAEAVSRGVNLLGGGAS
jgi:hypothetical protein